MIRWSSAISPTKSRTFPSQLFGTAHAKMDGGMFSPLNRSTSCMISPPTIPLKNITRSGMPPAEATTLASNCSVSSASPKVLSMSVSSHVTRRTNPASMASSSARHRRVSSAEKPTSRIASGPKRPSATPPGASEDSASISANSARAATSRTRDAETKLSGFR